jgi:hypothetical protein
MFESAMPPRRTIEISRAMLTTRLGARYHVVGGAVSFVSFACLN